MPSEVGFELHSPRYGLFLVLGLVGTNCAQSRLFLAIFRPFLGHIVELEGKKGLFVTGKSSRTCSVRNRFPSLSHFQWVLGLFWVFNGSWGCFGPKKAVLGQKMRTFGRAPRDLAAMPWGAIGELGALWIWEGQVSMREMARVE